MHMFHRHKEWGAFLVVIVAIGSILVFGFISQPVEIRNLFSENRAGMILISSNRSDSGDNPFILEAKIISETPKDLIVDVKYFLSETVDGEYNISVHPDNSDWSYSTNTMHSGINHEIITVSYRPDPPQKEKSESKLLHLYVNKYDKGSYLGAVFDRKISFPKTWSN